MVLARFDGARGADQTRSHREIIRSVICRRAVLTEHFVSCLFPGSCYLLIMYTKQTSPTVSFYPQSKIRYVPYTEYHRDFIPASCCRCCCTSRFIVIIPVYHSNMRVGTRNSKMTTDYLLSAFVLLGIFAVDRNCSKGACILGGTLVLNLIVLVILG